MDLRDYYLKGIPLTYNDHSSEAVEFSRDIQNYFKKHFKESIKETQESTLDEVSKTVNTSWNFVGM
jgi:hypothetical protein